MKTAKPGSPKLTALVGLMAGLFLPGCAAYAVAEPPPPLFGSNAPVGVARLAPGPQLLIDDYLIERSVGLVRTVHQPERLPGPIITPRKWYLQSRLAPVAVHHDPDLRRFRMWFIAVREATQSGAFYAYAESEDGMHWLQPDLGIVEIDGSTTNNAIAPRADMLVLIDRGLGFSEPAKRYILVTVAPVESRKALWVRFSPDGLRFVDHPGNPVYHDPPGGRFDDGMAGNWDPLQQRFLLISGYDGFVEDGYPRPSHTGSSEPGRKKPKNAGIGQFWSEDLLHWSPFRRIFSIDPEARGAERSTHEQLNPPKPFVRGGLYFGFLLVKRDDLPGDAEGSLRTLGWTELCTSRDGENWIRQPGTFFDRSAQRGAWDRDLAWVRECVTVGDSEFLYYNGVEEGRRGLGLAKLRRNGFVSHDAGPTGGILRTRLFVFAGDAVTVNSRIAGEMKVRVLDESGLPILGFSNRDCEPLRGDLLDQPVRWKGNVASLNGKPVRLEFSLWDAELYGFAISPS